MEIGLEEGGKFVIKKKIKTNYNQAGKLLPSIMKILKDEKLDLKKVMKIKVANKGGSFTSLRIGVVTANALGFALGVPVEGETKDGKKFDKIAVVEPIYDREPNISIKNERLKD